MMPCTSSEAPASRPPPLPGGPDLCRLCVTPPELASGPVGTKANRSSFEIERGCTSRLQRDCSAPGRVYVVTRRRLATPHIVAVEVLLATPRPGSSTCSPALPTPRPSSAAIEALSLTNEGGRDGGVGESDGGGGAWRGRRRRRRCRWRWWNGRRRRRAKLRRQWRGWSCSGT